MCASNHSLPAGSLKSTILMTGKVQEGRLPDWRRDNTAFLVSR